jgi:hypothetical protein
MELSDPFRIRLAVEHIEYLDSRRGGHITTRAQALRDVLSEAMRRDRRRQQAAQRRNRAHEAA